MHRFIPHTEAEERIMLDAIGVSETGELFSDIPEALRFRGLLDIPAAMSEIELADHMNFLAGKNVNTSTHVCFTGGGVYDHYVPAAVGLLSGRSEFYTAYTPYQAEISQGTLQAIFEYQTMICELTGMDISNASVYDGATACAEAMLLAFRQTGRTGMIIAGAVNPEYVECCRTYARFCGLEVTFLPADETLGTTCPDRLAELIDGQTALVLLQTPNFYGITEDIEEIGMVVKDKGALFAVACDPISLGILEKPSEFGADIVIGEGQALGNAMSFGGPGFGFFACKNEFVRKMPGRIAGETVDDKGRRGWVLTMQAREQHIRREKATSNICTNQALCALNATIYMSIMGKEGLREAAANSLQKAHYMYDRLIATGRFSPRFSAPFFKEFALEYKGETGRLLEVLKEAGFMPGIDLTPMGLDNCLLIAVTEKRTKAQIDAYVRKAGEAL